MAKIYKGIQELIGNTPLVEAVNLEKKLGLKAKKAFLTITHMKYMLCFLCMNLLWIKHT